MRRRSAFTLVELIVVVLILGILGAVSVPCLLWVGDCARDNSAKQTLRVVRDAIDQYLIENGGYPGADGTEATFKADLTLYLRGEFPACPVGPARGNNEVRIVTKPGSMTGHAEPTRGWRYNNVSGVFILNWDAPTATDPKIYYDQL